MRLAAFLILAVASTWFLWGSFLHSLGRTSRDGMVLFDPSTPPPTIFVTKKAGSAELEAARDMARILEKWSHQTVNIRFEPIVYRGRGIYIGHSLLATRSGVPDVAKFDQPLWHSAGNSLLIYGQDSEASALAVYAFLRTEGQVRWYLPGILGEVIPEKMSLEVAPGMHAEIPSFIARRTDFTQVDRQASNLWARRNGLREHFNYNHNLHRIFNEDLFEREPEVFPLINGRRIRPSTARGGYESQPNLSNPRAAEIAADAAINFFQRNPEAYSFSVALNDSYAFGDYPEDFVHFDPTRFYRGVLDYSDTVFAFTNAVAEKVAKEFPDKYIGALSYANYENVPSFKVAPKVIPYMTADRSQWYDPKFRAQDLELIRAWVDNGPEIIGTWDYFFGAMYLIPRLAHGPLVESIQYMHANGLKAYFSQMGPAWGFDALKAWMMANLLWDAEQDAEALRAQFMSDMYGPAAGTMDAFYTRCEEIWMAQPPPAFWLKYYANPHQAVLFSAQNLGELRGLLEEAMLMADSELQRARIDLSRQAFSVTEAFWAFQQQQWLLAAMEVDSSRTFQQLLKELEVYARLSDHLINQSQATRQLPDAAQLVVGHNGMAPGGLNGALSRTDWAYRTSPVSRLAYNAVNWIRNNSDINDLWRLHASLAKIDQQNWDSLLPAWFRSRSTGQVLLNGSFESEPFDQHWLLQAVPWDGAEYGASQKHRFSGDQSCRFYQTGYHDLSQNLRVNPGSAIYASAQVKGIVSDGAIVRLDLLWYDSHMKPMGQAVADRLPPSSHRSEPNEWYPLGVAAIVPEGAAIAKLRLMVRALLPGDEVFADDFSFRIHQ